MTPPGYPCSISDLHDNSHQVDRNIYKRRKSWCVLIPTEMVLTNKDNLVDLLLIDSPLLHWHNFIYISNCLQIHLKKYQQKIDIINSSKAKKKQQSNARGNGMHRLLTWSMCDWSEQCIFKTPFARRISTPCSWSCSHSSCSNHSLTYTGTSCWYEFSHPSLFMLPDDPNFTFLPGLETHVHSLCVPFQGKLSQFLIYTQWWRLYHDSRDLNLDRANPLAYPCWQIAIIKS
jgi:hypothetical protein